MGRVDLNYCCVPLTEYSVLRTPDALPLEEQEGCGLSLETKQHNPALLSLAPCTRPPIRFGEMSGTCGCKAHSLIGPSLACCICSTCYGVIASSIPCERHPLATENKVQNQSVVAFANGSQLSNRLASSFPFKLANRRVTCELQACLVN